MQDIADSSSLSIFNTYLTFIDIEAEPSLEEEHNFIAHDDKVSKSLNFPFPNLP